MIWVLLRGVERPRFWLRATVDLLIVGFLVAPPVYWGVVDRAPPWIEARGTVEKLELARGDFQEIQWNTVEQRYCGEVRVRRSLLSDGDAHWLTPLSEVVVVMDPDLPRPVMKRGASPPFQIPYGMPLGKAFYRVDIIAACNWLQEWLPERWRIHATLPLVSFLVTEQQEQHDDHNGGAGQPQRQG
jgi:hypothetical protein